MMKISILTTATGVLAAGLIMAGVGLFAAVGPINPEPAPAAFAPAPPEPDDPVARSKSMDAIKTLGLALLNYGITHDNRFPPPRPATRMESPC